MSSKIILFSLSAIAFPALLGGLLVNGTLEAMLRAWLTGYFSPGQPCYSLYTGLPIIDQFEAIQVTFWEPIIQGGVTRLQAIMLCASLQTAGLWAAIENTRDGHSHKHWILRYAPIYCFFWGACGVATLLPIYLHIELTHRQRAIRPTMSLAKARSLLPALLIGLVYPYYLMLFTPSGATVAQRQGFIVFYQFSPFFVYAVIQTFSSFLGREGEGESESLSSASPSIEGKYAYHRQLKLVKTAYAVAGIWSGLAYIGSILVTLFSNGDSSVSLVNLFMPSLSAVSRASPETHIREGSFLFMKIDYAIVWLACLIYATKTAEMIWMGGPAKMRTIRTMTGSVVIAGLALSAAMFLLGPGAVVSGLLYVREEKLRDWAEEEEDVGKKSQGSIKG